MSGGGAERITLTLATALAKDGYLVDIVLVHKVGPYLDQLDQGVRIVELSAPRMMLAVPALARYLKEEKPQAVVSGLTSANVVLMASRLYPSTKTKRIIVVHNHISSATLAHKNLTHKIATLLARQVYKYADEIIAVSGGLADELSTFSKVPRDQVKVIYNPVVNAKLRQHANANQPKDWIEDKGPVIIAIGRLCPQKDFPTLMKSFALLRKRKAAQLLILGEGEERLKLEALVKELGIEADVYMPGFVENPYAYLVHADVFALSSRWEGLPTVLIEALACGCAVVATDCPHGPKEILENGAYGHLVEMGNVEAFAAALEDAIDNPVDKSHQRHRAADFSEEASVKAYANIMGL